MDRSRRRAAVVLALLAVLSALVLASPSTATAETVEADWQLGEEPGAPFMLDGSGKAHNGALSPGAAAAGLTLESGVYHWSLRCPACLPAAPARVVQVPDSTGLDIPDPTVRYALEFRFKTNKGYGNIMQKGQATTAGGQIKVENPNGFTRCVFLGANGAYVSVPSPIALNDGVWHIVKCVHNATSVETWVDGVKVAVKNQRTGPIDNAKPFVIGGKIDCNQITVTCDYFSGYVDWVRITRGPEQPAQPGADGGVHTRVRRARLHVRRVGVLGSREATH